MKNILEGLDKDILGIQNIDYIKRLLKSSNVDIFNNASVIKLNTAHRQTTSGNPHRVSHTDLIGMPSGKNSDHDGRYYTEAELDSGQLDNRYYTETELDNGQLDELYTSRSLVNGSFKETFNALVDSDGATITMSLEQSGGGDLTMQFSDGDTVLDCTSPQQTIELTAGTVPSPQPNYIYILQSDKILTKSTTGFPATEHIKVGFFFAQTATEVQAEGGTLINQNWNDHLSGTNNQGHLLHISKVLRIGRGGASYFSGLGGAGGDDYTTSSAGVVTFQMGSGIIIQAHEHIVSAIDTSGSDTMIIVNAESALGAYYKTQNLYDIDNDADGNTLNNKYFNILVWVTGNKTGQYSPVMINLPTGSYNTLTAAQQDNSGYDVRSMPREFNLDSSTGVFVCRLTFRKTGGTWVYQSTVNLRGVSVGSITGGIIGGTVTEFSDSQFSIYNNVDPTKITDISSVNITSGNTRIITMADLDVDLADIGTNATAIALNTTHRGSDGKDHSDVVLNNTHRGSDGKDHSDVVLNNTHRGSDGKNHSDVVLNNTHRGSDGTDHSDVVANTAALVPLTDDSMADALHRHSELSASDGSPNPALSVDTAGNVIIGTGSPIAKLDVVGNVSCDENMSIIYDGNIATLNLRSYRNASSGGAMQAYVSRGSVATKTALVDNDQVFWFRGHGYDGSNYARVGHIAIIVDDTVATNDVKGRFSVQLNDGSSLTNLTERFRIGSGGGIYIDEISAAEADIAGYGQFWVKNTTPCQIWFTDDAGTDHQLAYV